MKLRLTDHETARVLLDALTRRGDVPPGEHCCVVFRPKTPESEFEAVVMWGDDLPAEPMAELIALDDYR